VIRTQCRAFEDTRNKENQNKAGMKAAHGEEIEPTFLPGRTKKRLQASNRK